MSQSLGEETLTASYLFLKRPRISAHWLSWDDTQSLNVVETQKQAEEIPFIQRTRPCCYATDKALKRGHVWATIVLHSSFSLQGPILYTCHVLLPLSWPIFFWKLFSKLQKEAGTRAFKRTCPLEFNYVCCWVLTAESALSSISDNALFSAHSALSFRLLAGEVSSWAGITAKQIITAYPNVSNLSLL